MDNIIEVNVVTMRFNLAEEKTDSLKLVGKKLKHVAVFFDRQLSSVLKIDTCYLYQLCLKIHT